MPTRRSRWNRALAGLLAACLTVAPAAVRADEPAPPVGRFLYAADDDWDWATPLGAEKPSRLARYGAMPWSALDWAGEGLPVVRAALVGTPPDPVKTMTMEQLSKLRGKNSTFTHHPQAPGTIERLLENADPPNLIILMQNTGGNIPLDPASITALLTFVKQGGRLVVLDDWNIYPPLLDAFVETALQLPPGPPLREVPAPALPAPELAPPEQAPAAPPQPADPKPDHDAEDLKKRFEALLPDLGSEEFKLREEASKAILALGPKLLDLLPDIETDDPEVASRLAEIREALSPKPLAKPEPGMSKEEQLARRLAKLAASAKVVTDADQKLRQGNTSHDLPSVIVDGDHRTLPILRLSFPPLP